MVFCSLLRCIIHPIRKTRQLILCYLCDVCVFPFLLVFSAVPIVSLTIYDSPPFSFDVPSHVQLLVAFAGSWRGQINVSTCDHKRASPVCPRFGCGVRSKSHHPLERCCQARSELLARATFDQCCKSKSIAIIDIVAHLSLFFFFRINRRNEQRSVEALQELLANNLPVSLETSREQAKV